MAYTAYVPSYKASDVSAIVIDGIGKYGVALIAFVSIIVLIMLGAWASRNVKKIG